jgi:hypothetical protein
MWRRYDWSALIPFVDLEHEVVLVDDVEDESDEGNRLLRRLKVVETSEVFEARAPEDGGLSIKAKGPGGIPPAPSEGLGVLSPKVPIVFGHNITTLPKPPPVGGSGKDAPPQIPQKRTADFIDYQEFDPYGVLLAADGDILQFHLTDGFRHLDRIEGARDLAASSPYYELIAVGDAGLAVSMDRRTCE